jgi:hypothetical protein
MKVPHYDKIDRAAQNFHKSDCAYAEHSFLDECRNRRVFGDRLDNISGHKIANIFKRKNFAKIDVDIRRTYVCSNRTRCREIRDAVRHSRPGLEHHKASQLVKYDMTHR